MLHIDLSGTSGLEATHCTTRSCCDGIPLKTIDFQLDAAQAVGVRMLSEVVYAVIEAGPLSVSTQLAMWDGSAQVFHSFDVLTPLSTLPAQDSSHGLCESWQSMTASGRKVHRKTESMASQSRPMTSWCQLLSPEDVFLLPWYLACRTASIIRLIAWLWSDMNRVVDQHGDQWTANTYLCSSTAIRLARTNNNFLA